MKENNVELVDLPLEEMVTVEGGAPRTTCAIIGVVTVAAAVSQQWWAVAGMGVAGYANGCFSSW